MIKRLLMPFCMTIFIATGGIASADPKISNCDISPKEITYKTEVTISFDYQNVEGGLKTGKVTLTQKIQFPGQKEVVTRTSNWQSYLSDLSAFPSESGRFERKFVNADIWRGPAIELVYEFRVVDGKGRESNVCTAKITPK